MLVLCFHTTVKMHYSAFCRNFVVNMYESKSQYTVKPPIREHFADC